MMQGADRHLDRVVLPQRRAPGVVEQIVDDGRVQFRPGAEGPPGQGRREAQQVQSVGRPDVHIDHGVHGALPLGRGVRMRVQGRLQGAQELRRIGEDGAGLRARQRGVVGPEGVAVQERPEVVVEGGPDPGLGELRQRGLGAVPQRHGGRVIPGQGGLGPVRGAAARGGDDERFPAGRQVLQLRASARRGRNVPPRPSVSWPIMSKKFRPMPRTRTGLTAGIRDQSTSAGAAGGK